MERLRARVDELTRAALEGRPARSGQTPRAAPLLQRRLPSPTPNSGPQAPAISTGRDRTAIDRRWPMTKIEQSISTPLCPPHFPPALATPARSSKRVTRTDPGSRWNCRPSRCVAASTFTAASAPSGSSGRRLARPSSPCRPWRRHRKERRRSQSVPRLQVPEVVVYPQQQHAGLSHGKTADVLTALGHPADARRVARSSTRAGRRLRPVYQGKSSRPCLDEETP